MGDNERQSPQGDPTEAAIRSQRDTARRSVAMIKSRSWGGSGGVQQTRIIPNDKDHNLFLEAGAIAPPLHPALLSYWLRSSPHLRPNIAAYVANIDGFGQRFDQVLDIDDDEVLSQEVYLERLRLQRAERRRLAIEDGAVPNETIASWPKDPWPQESELPELRENLRIAMRKERAQLAGFFGAAAGDVSFTTLRRHTRKDWEGFGYAFWEVLRHEVTRELCEFNLAPTMHMRMMPQDEEFTKSTEKRRSGKLGYETVVVERRYRRFVQCLPQSNRVTWFKEYGDPRLISSVDGQQYASTHAKDANGNYTDRFAEASPGRLRRLLPDGHSAASEMIHWRVYDAEFAYGLPRWWAALLEIAGSREASELNYRYFQQNGVPPLMLILEGASVDDELDKEFAETIESRTTGTENQHRIMTITLQGNPGAPAENQPRAKLERLRDAQQDDALFLKYMQRADDIVGMQFRQPRILRGDSEGHNRANADTAVAMTEAQVYQPEREEFDEFMNRRILPDLGILYWKFVTNATKTRDPDGLRETMQIGWKSGALVPADMRPVMGNLLDRELPPIDEPWMHQPIDITRTQIQAGEFPPRELLPTSPEPAPSESEDDPIENPLVDDEDEGENTEAELSRFKSSDDDEFLPGG